MHIYFKGRFVVDALLIGRYLMRFPIRFVVVAGIVVATASSTVSLRTGPSRDATVLFLGGIVVNKGLIE